MHNHNYKKPCGCKESKVSCGCKEPQVCGCAMKYDLLCSFYSGVSLNPIGIEPGMDGNTIIRMLVNYFEGEISEIQIDPTVIKSIGDKIDIYKGLSDAFVHEIKSIQGQPNGGVIVENIQNTPNDCNDKGDYINVRIDEDWLTSFLNEWITTVDLCALTANCGGQPIQNPIVTTVPFSQANRGTYTFTLADFTSHYNDPQNNPLTTIKLIGNIVGYKLNGVPYVLNTEITTAQLTSGALQYVANNVDTQYIYTSPYQAKSSADKWSNISNIVVTVAAKVFIQLSSVNVSLIRGVSNTKTATVNYNNATGQVLSTGQVLYTTGVVGQPGYLSITVQSGTTLTGTGSFVININSIPSNNQLNQTVNYIIDGSTGLVNLTYNSNPVTQDLVIDLPNRGTHNFTTAEFVAKYTDFDGNNMVEMKADGNTINYLFNGSPYISGTWIPINDIDELTYIGANQNGAYQQINPWVAKDSQGNIST